MTIAERNNKLKHFITCLKCEVSGKPCDVNCSTQYDAGNMGEIIENLEAISKALEQETVSKESYEHEYFLRKEFEIKIAKLEQQEPILDKIRAEILKLDDADYDFEGYYKAVTDALAIIDKYRGGT